MIKKSDDYIRTDADLRDGQENSISVVFLSSKL